MWLISRSQQRPHAGVSPSDTVQLCLFYSLFFADLLVLECVCVCVCDDYNILGKPS